MDRQTVGQDGRMDGTDGRDEGTDKGMDRQMNGGTDEWRVSFSLFFSDSCWYIRECFDPQLFVIASLHRSASIPHPLFPSLLILISGLCNLTRLSLSPFVRVDVQCVVFLFNHPCVQLKKEVNFFHNNFEFPPLFLNL